MFSHKKLFKINIIYLICLIKKEPAQLNKSELITFQSFY